MPKIHITSPEFLNRMEAEYRRDLRPYRNVVDVDYYVEQYRAGNAIDAEEMDLAEGSDDIVAAAQFASMLAGKTEEAQREIFSETLARLMAGEKVFHGQPDPQKTFAENRLHERAAVHVNYLTSLMKVAQMYSANEADRTSRLNGLGTRFVNPSDVPDALIGNAVRVAYFKLASLNGSNRVMGEKIAAWESLQDPQQPPMAGTRKALFVLRGAKLLSELAEKHFNREKPSFFKRFFRTKEAREYAAERVLLNRVADRLKTLDPHGDLAGRIDEKVNERFRYDDFKRKNAYLSQETQQTVEELLGPASSPLSATRAEYESFRDYDLWKLKMDHRVEEMDPRSPALSEEVHGFLNVDDYEREPLEEEQLENDLADRLEYSEELSEDGIRISDPENIKQV